MKLPLCISSLMLALVPLPGADSWAFQPGEDAFSPDAAVDLRALNERVAGEKGFVRRSADGNDFVLGDGSPARFWAIDPDIPAKSEDMEFEARFLAKRGVNLVRFGAVVMPNLKKHPNSRMDEIDRDILDRTWRWVAALKLQGIYSLIVPYWPMDAIPESWGVKGHKSMIGVLFCDKTFQDGYKSWLRALYGEKNPYTGVPLAQEPSVAVIQLQNEDSLLFWTIDRFLGDKGQPYDELRKDFGDFAAKKYGSIDQALKAWNGEKVEGDEPEQGRLGFIRTWNALNPPAGHDAARGADQFAFCANEMRSFNTGIETFLREELGCKQLVNACNWKTADNVKLNDLERWAYGANEVMAVNRYFSPYHDGARSGWAIEPKDHYVNGSVTLEPTKLTLNVKQPVGYPFVVTETCWTTPDLYQAEETLMGAAYSSLTGLDAVFWNGTGVRSWQDAVAPWGSIMYKWPFATPVALGQFPAAAWLYRKGYAKQGEPAVHEERALDDLWHQRQPLIAEESGYDPNRDAGLPTNSAVKTTVDPLAYLVGRVEVVYGGDPAKSKVIDLARYVDKDKQTVGSVTGEERIDYHTGLFTLDAPKAQAAAGFLAKAGPVALHDVTIACSNPYAAITVVALDDQPLAASKKVLVQIGTTVRPTDWKEHEADFKDPKSGKQVHGFVVDAVGKNPWQVESAAGTVTIRNAVLVTATALDANLVRAKPAEGKQEGGAFTLTLPPDALYVIVEAR